MSQRFPGRRLSLVRLTFVIGVTVALAMGGTTGFRTWQDSRQASGSEPWFSAYVDVTATPTYAFEQPSADHELNTVLSFIVAAERDTCEASWGTYYSLDEANVALDLERRIARLRQSGGNILISLGGEANSNLALACDSADSLAAQYRDIIDRYDPAALDLDIEGEALTDLESRQRRVDAIAQIQDGETDPLPIWLTLPVGPSGLTTDGVEIVREFLEAGVSIAGVNAMTMNYASQEAADDLGQVVISSLEATHRQIMAIYADHGTPLGSQTAWRRLGATPMIGQNNIIAEVFSLDDARELHEFATSVGLGRMSMWSANRDRTCADAYAAINVMSDSCSSIDQGDETFAEILSGGFTGSPSESRATDDPADNVRPEDIVDDPETSPYPVWNATATYPANTRVVWRKNVYSAEWWNTAIQPDDPALNATDNPWHLIGPVLPGETPVPILTLPADYYPLWDIGTTYTRGDRVMFNDVAYEAQWWTVGDNPAAGQEDPGASPWRVITQEEIEVLLAE